MRFEISDKWDFGVVEDAWRSMTPAETGYVLRVHPDRHAELRSQILVCGNIQYEATISNGIDPELVISGISFAECWIEEDEAVSKDEFYLTEVQK